MGGHHLCHGAFAPQQAFGNFEAHLHDKRVICLEIPDEYEFMAPQLVQLLKARVPRHLPSV
jgi:predicted protein tyrosine phosphatase